MEFTPNFNENAGGFLVDPNAPEYGGTFGVAIGTDGTRNSVVLPAPQRRRLAPLRDRDQQQRRLGAMRSPPTSTASRSAASRKASRTGPGPFANSTLYLMSRAGSALFGNGSLDELAIYNQPLDATTVFQHYHSHGTSTRHHAVLHDQPEHRRHRPERDFDASGSTDAQGTITDYKWDLDGSGNYAIDTGSTPTLTHAFTAAGNYTVGLKTTDSTAAPAPR